MQKESFKHKKFFHTSIPKFLKKEGKKTKPLMCMQTNFATMSKKTNPFETHMQMKKHTTFASINKRKVRLFLLYFSRKYEAHKAIFSM